MIFFIQKKTHEVSTQGPLTSKEADYQKITIKTDVPDMAAISLLKAPSSVPQINNAGTDSGMNFDPNFSG